MKKVKFKVAMSMIMAVVAGFVLVVGCIQDEESALIAEKNDFLNLEKAASAIEFMPLNTVPEWVKDRVSGKEYEAWVRLSSRYEIDYSILTQTLTSKKMSCINILIRCGFSLKIVWGKGLWDILRLPPNLCLKE